MIRLIELFSGIGAQAAALKRLGIEFEQWITSEWEVNAVASYKAIHTSDDTDYSKDIPDNELNYILFDLGVSTDGKKQLTLDQIKRKGESWKRTVYNNFKATNNIGSIVNAKADDLKIQDTGKFTYLLTYSFPCQDLSVAGKGKGMKKGSGTRSGMLWEVERLLNECKELPQILLMENVPQVHGKKNIDDFNQWINFLENKGYHNFWKDLNAKDFGVAQNRNRTFMVSLLNRKSYNFPTPIPLTKKMKDYLEDEVDEKYYLKGEKVQKLLDNLIMSGKISTDRQTDRQLTELSTIHGQSTEQTVSRQDTMQESQIREPKATWCVKGLGSNSDKYEPNGKQIDVACTLCARDYKGLGNQGGNGVTESKNGVIENEKNRKA